MSEKQEFIIILEPHRPISTNNFTKAETKAIQEHFSYLQQFLEKETIVLVGRCNDTTFGIVIIEANSFEGARKIMKNDPAVKLGFFRSNLALSNRSAKTITLGNFLIY